MSFLIPLTDAIMGRERRRDFNLFRFANDIYRSLITGRHKRTLLLLQRLSEEDLPVVVENVIEQLRIDSKKNPETVILAVRLLHYSELTVKHPAWMKELDDPKTTDYRRYCLKMLEIGDEPLSIHDWRRSSYSQESEDSPDDR